MKNKFRMIDINIVSTYMGRYLTLGVTVVVLAITISALTGPGGLRNHRPLTLVVPSRPGGGDTTPRFEPLRELLAIETGRRVWLQNRAEESCRDCDLFVMTLQEFLDEQRFRDLVPLYSIEAIERGRDAAVLIARGGVAPMGSPPGVDDVMFSHPRSINGCWVQLGLLESEGFRTPGRLDSLRFAPAPAPGAGLRVVYSVATGECALGACRASDLSGAVRAGGVGRGELSIVRSSPAVPELLIACRAADADYYLRVLTKTAARVAASAVGARDRDAVELLKSRGMRSLRPISGAEIERAAALYEKMEERNRAAE
jgi:hypothetical protein